MPREIRPRVRRLFSLGVRRRDLIAAQTDEELRFHLEARIERLVAIGLSRDAATAEALRRLSGESNLQVARRQLQQSAGRRERRMAWSERVGEFLQDVRYAARGLANRPGFTTVAIITLAIGIGANTAIFGAVNALLLRPLPFPEPDRLMEISLTRAPEGAQNASAAPELAPWSWPKFTLYRDGQTSFSEVALWADGQATITSGDAERVYNETVSARYLATLGVRPILGRDFPREEDAQPGAPRLALISHALWSRRFSADPAAIGRTLDISGSPYEIVGVLPPTFRGLSGRADLLVPVTVRAADELSEAWSLEFSQIGRLRPGVTAGRAASEAATLGRRVNDATPMLKGAVGSGTVGGWSASARLLDETRVAPQIRRSLLILFGAVGFVLLIACVNLANLLLGRAASRRKEIAVRIAVGAGRGRLVRLLLTESLVLSFLGGAASIGVAWLGTRALSSVNPQAALQAQQLAGLGIVDFGSIRLDLPALLFTLGVAVVVGLVFGLVPALQATRVSLQEQLKDGSAKPLGVGAGRSRTVTSRRLLVISEIAMALVLLVGAGLMIRSLKNRLRIDPGFEASQLLTIRLAMAPDRVSRDSLPGFYEALMARLGAIPGVTKVGLADCPPLNGGCNGTVITFPDRPPPPKGAEPSIGVHFISPSWFETMRVPLKRGRLLGPEDRMGTPKSLVINETAARKYWPNEDPIGKRAAVWQGGFHDGATVVGIVGDVRFTTIDSLAAPDAYISYDQSPRSYMMIFLRTTIDPEAIIGAARAVITELSPSYPAYDVRTMESRVASATAQARVSALLFGLFGGIALSLAVVGIYGVMSFAVAQRTREIGIRMALGADRQSVLRLVIGEGMGLTLIGATVGLVLAFTLSRLLLSLLYEVTPSDPVTYLVIAVLLGSAAVLASWLPARRASRVSPTEALRDG